jgi:hypothetical protein
VLHSNTIKIYVRVYIAGVQKLKAEVRFRRFLRTTAGRLKDYEIVSCHSNTVAKFIVHYLGGGGGVKVDYGIGLSYRPASLCCSMTGR